MGKCVRSRPSHHTGAAALSKFNEALAATKLCGPKTNLDFVAKLAKSDMFVSGEYDTSSLVGFDAPLPLGMKIVDPGVMTTVQDWPGRTAEKTGGDAWRIGIPPSGPMDHVRPCLPFRLMCAV